METNVEFVMKRITPIRNVSNKFLKEGSELVKYSNGRTSILSSSYIFSYFQNKYIKFILLLLVILLCSSLFIKVINIRRHKYYLERV